MTDTRQLTCQTAQMDEDRDLLNQLMLGMAPETRHRMQRFVQLVAERNECALTIIRQIEAGRVSPTDALAMELGRRQPQGELIHHSDRGAQYTSDDFRDVLDDNEITCSMSARGNCFDNAAVESFFGLLKREWVNRVRYRTRDEARADIFDYLEVYYNRRRRHGYLGHLSPAEFEKQTVGL
jgi:transposase InsO family protein